MTFPEVFVLEKLAEMSKYQQELRDFLEFSDREIINDSGKIHIAERLLQLIVDAMLDVNQHFIKELNLDVADNFQSTFYILGQSGVLNNEFAQKIAPVVGLRNRVVHGYETLDKALFLSELRKDHQDFSKYIETVQHYLQTKIK